MDGDLEELLALGGCWMSRRRPWSGETAGVFLAEALLKVRTRTGAFAPLGRTGCSGSSSGGGDARIWC